MATYALSMCCDCWMYPWCHKNWLANVKPVSIIILLHFIRVSGISWCHFGPNNSPFMETFDGGGQSLFLSSTIAIYVTSGRIKCPLYEKISINRFFPLITHVLALHCKALRHLHIQCSPTFLPWRAGFAQAKIKPAFAALHYVARNSWTIHEMNQVASNASLKPLYFMPPPPPSQVAVHWKIRAPRNRPGVED